MSGAIQLEAVARQWDGDIDPWTPPVFIAAAAWRALTAAGVVPGPRWLPCGGDEEAVARAAGSAWARRRSAAPVTVEAVVTRPPDASARTRLDAIANRQLCVTAVAPRAPETLTRADRWCRGDPVAVADADVPSGLREWPAVRLVQLDQARGGLFADASPQDDPVADAREALRLGAAVEDALVLPCGEPPWQRLDHVGLVALAQTGAEGYRPVAVLERAGDLAQAMPAVAAAGLPLVVVARLEGAELERCVAGEGWWIAEAADRRGLHALLATALLDRAPWLLRLPAAWVHDLAPPGDLHEPGAGREVVSVDHPLRWLVATAGGLATARAMARLAAQRQQQVAVVQAASLRPFPWQACAGDCAVIEEPGSAALGACARAHGLHVTSFGADADPEDALGRWLAV